VRFGFWGRLSFFEVLLLVLLDYPLGFRGFFFDTALGKVLMLEVVSFEWRAKLGALKVQRSFLVYRFSSSSRPEDGSRET